jgi:hypothetical protein
MPTVASVSSRFFEDLFTRYLSRSREEILQYSMNQTNRAMWRMSMGPENRPSEAQAREVEEPQEERMVGLAGVLATNYALQAEHDGIRRRIYGETISMDEARAIYPERPPAPAPRTDTRPWAHLKSRDGWTKRIRVDSNVADRLIVPELRGGRRAVNLLDASSEISAERIESVEYRKIKSIHTVDHRSGTEKVEYWFEEI